MQPGLVSVVIPNYNYARYLREAIDSVLAQTYGDIEVIVVDDGSTDDSRGIIEGYGDRIVAIFQKNAGVCAARNAGFAVSNGEYIAFLDADDAWLPAKVEQQVAAFGHEPDVGLVHASVIEIDGTGNEIGRRTNGLSGKVARELLLLDRAVILGGGSGVMIRREALETVGGFDERMSTSADWDLYYRVASRYLVAFIDEPLVLYRIHGANMHHNVKAMERDVTLTFDAAFSNGQANSDIRSLCYGNFYRMLAGSYFRAQNYKDFAKNALLSVYYRPANIAYYMGLAGPAREQDN